MTRLCLFKVAIFASFATSLSFQMNQMINDTSSTTLDPASTADEPTPSPASPSTTLTPEQECGKLNGTGCDGCVKNPKCLFCFSDNTCKAYPVGHVLPRAEDCAGGLSQARWGQCWINFEALIIAFGVIGGVIILSFAICICCCCCRSKGNSKRFAREEARLERQKEERSVKATERRAARQARNDEIRKKYGIEIRGVGGLVRDDNPYQRFDA